MELQWATNVGDHPPSRQPLALYNNVSHAKACGKSSN